MTRLVAALAVLVALCAGDAVHAAEIQRGSVERVQTRGVEVPIHGYIGMEKEVVDLIAAWIKTPGA